MDLVMENKLKVV
jgi:hypothetical protein